MRDADELHDALATLIVVPPVAQWTHWFDELVSQRRATALRCHADDSVLARDAAARCSWTCADDASNLRRASMTIACAATIASVRRHAAETRPSTEILRGWLESSGPVTVGELARTLARRR